MSLDANGESVPARSSLVCMSCCPHRQCSVESPRQRCCRNWPTESRSLNANGESVPFAVRTGLHFMQYNHRGSCMRRPPCRHNTITESRCRQCSVERRVAPCRRNTITEVAARASMPTERRRWSAFHAARTGNVRLRVPASAAASIPSPMNALQPLVQFARSSLSPSPQASPRIAQGVDRVSM